MFGKITDLPPCRDRASFASQETGRAGSFGDDAQQDFDKRRLAGTIGAEQAEDLSLFDFEANIFQRFKSFSEDRTRTVGFAEVRRRNRWLSAWWRGISGRLCDYYGGIVVRF